MLNTFQAAWTMLREAASDWLEDKAPQLGASLAFYSVLSIAPLIVLAMAIAAVFFDEEAVRGQLLTQMESLLGSEGAEAIREMLSHAQKPAEGMLAAVLGIATLLLGASGVFGQLQDAMNTIWEVPSKAQSGIWSFIRTRFLSFAMVLGVGFLLLVSLILSAVIAGAGGYLNQLFPALEPLSHLTNAVVTFLLMTFLFAAIYKWLPDVKVAWHDVWTGAILTAALFTLGKFLIGLYLGKAGLGSAYGAAGSLVVLIVWVYYSAQVLFFGAELTQVYARRYGSKIVPSQAPDDVSKRDINPPRELPSGQMRPV